MPAADGKFYNTNIADVETLLRLIKCVQNPKSKTSIDYVVCCHLFIFILKLIVVSFHKLLSKFQTGKK
jgi:hypothetical protein